ncbi:MAG: hypothetical protein J5I98_00455, partial [Phaeodactylibacter sp.]|nr:hypothetical protein [Phaeodactylibacter sp.]
INSTNLQELRNLSTDDYFNFSYIKPPKGLNLAALKAVFAGLGLPDLTNNLKDEGTFVKLATAADEMSKQAVTLKARITNGLQCRGVDVITEWDASTYRTQFDRMAGFCDKLRNYTSEAKLKNFQYSKEEVDKVFAQKHLLSEVAHKIEQAGKFESHINYLQQCLQYLPPDGLKQEIQDAIHQLGPVLGEGKEREIAQYEASLLALKERYANYYLEKYTEYRISEKDETARQALLHSEQKKVCDILKEADFLSTALYKTWLEKLLKLQPAARVNKEAVLRTPYHDFNLLDHLGKPKVTVQELKTELGEIFDEWETALKETLEDPAVRRNMDAIGPEDVELLEKFKQGQLPLNEQRAVQVRDILNDLHQGLDKIELSTESLKPTFNKPLTPDEAVEAFKAYIEEVTRGKDRDKVRIILK